VRRRDLLDEVLRHGDVPRRPDLVLRRPLEVVVVDLLDVLGVGHDLQHVLGSSDRTLRRPPSTSRYFIISSPCQLMSLAIPRDRLFMLFLIQNSSHQFLTASSLMWNESPRPIVNLCMIFTAAAASALWFTSWNARACM